MAPTASAGPTTVKSGKATKTAQVAQVQLVLTRTGRVLYVKVLSPKHTAKIRISLVGAKNKLMKNVMRNVKTNSRVKVKHLLIGKQVKHVNVKVMH